MGPGTAPYAGPCGSFWRSVPGVGGVGVVVVDALVIMQLKLLQSLLFLLLVVPQTQLNFRVPDVPVVCTHLWWSTFL